MTNSGRILKSNQLENHEIVVIGNGSSNPATSSTGQDPLAPVEEALLFTASEVEDLCAKARASGAADAAVTLEPAIGQLVSAMTSFAHDREIALQHASEGSARAVVDTAISITRWVLGRELSEPNALLELVSRALDEPLTTRPCVLHVHPELISLIYDASPDNVELVPDQTLELGEFRVVSDGPEVALDFETTFARAGEVLGAKATASEVEAQ